MEMICSLEIKPDNLLETISSLAFKNLPNSFTTSQDKMLTSVNKTSRICLDSIPSAGTITLRKLTPTDLFKHSKDFANREVSGKVNMNLNKAIMTTGVETNMMTTIEGMINTSNQVNL
jgi:hypothetical protein